MERLTDKKEADAQRLEYENRLKNGYPRNIPEERFLKLAAYEDAMPLEQAQELAKAEKDGRLVVLPVPVGAGKIAYGLTNPGDGPQRIVTIECDYLEKLEIWDNPGHEVVVEVDGWEIGESDIGKTVFLTREEAEAALKKRE